MPKERIKGWTKLGLGIATGFAATTALYQLFFS